MDEPYLIEGWRVMVNTWGADSHLRHPTADERPILDRYFASRRSRNPDGSVEGLFGKELKGIEGDIITYPVARRE